jgi:hypothetical protein
MNIHSARLRPALAPREQNPCTKTGAIDGNPARAYDADASFQTIIGQQDFFLDYGVKKCD